MKKILITILVLTTLLVSACSGSNLLDILKADSQINQFLDDYPDADITIAKIKGEQVIAENTKVQEFCGINLEEKAHYKVMMTDDASDLELYAYVDIETQEIICLKKVGKEIEKKEEIKEKYKEEIKTEEKTEEKTKSGTIKETKIIHEAKPEDKIEDVDCDKEIELEGEVDDDKVVLEWDEYECEGFDGYKVVWSDEVEFPKYPEDGYLKFITNKETTRYEDKLRVGKNYYSITVITDNGKVYLDPISIEVESSEESDDESGDEKEEINQDIILKYNLENGNLELEWTEYEGDNLEYYKVVWSQTNPDLMYPEDGYIKYMSDEHKYNVPSEKFKEGINYYRITTVLKDGTTINSNVEKIEK